jgi:hypothetical protein
LKKQKNQGDGSGGTKAKKKAKGTVLKGDNRKFCAQKGTTSEWS